MEIGLALGTNPKILLLDEPLAGMSPTERADTVKLLKQATASGRTLVVVEHDMDALFGMADRAVTVLAQGRILTEAHAGRSAGERRRAGCLSRGRPRMSYLEIDKINSFYGDSHILFDVSMRLEQREVVALLGRNGAGKSTTLNALMGGVVTKSGSIVLEGRQLRGSRQDAIAGAGCSWCRNRAASSAASVSSGTSFGGLQSPPGRLDRVYTMFPRLKDRRFSRGRFRAANSICWRSPGR